MLSPMTAKIFRLAEHRLRRQARAALTPGWALERALRAVAASDTTDFSTNARTFERVFKEELARSKELRELVRAERDDREA